MNVWETRLLQFVWFITTSDPVKANKLFEMLTDEEVITFQQNASPNAGMPFLSSASGYLDGLKLTLQVNHGRVDLLIESGEDPIDGQIKAIGFSLQALFDLFLQRISDEFLTVIGPVTRVAIVSHGFQETNSYKEAAEIIFRAANLSIEWDGHSDLVFQINKRKVLPNFVEINRLMQFSVTAQMSLSLDLASMQGTLANIGRGEERLLVSFNLDLNTVPKGLIFKIDEEKRILRDISLELLRLASRRTVIALGDENA
jgi:hypothetical protein